MKQSVASLNFNCLKNLYYVPAVQNKVLQNRNTITYLGIKENRESVKWKKKYFDASPHQLFVVDGQDIDLQIQVVLPLIDGQPLILSVGSTLYPDGVNSNRI